jgi:hypothetical protein
MGNLRGAERGIFCCLMLLGDFSIDLLSVFLFFLLLLIDVVTASHLINLKTTICHSFGRKIKSGVSSAILQARGCHWAEILKVMS